MRQTSITVYGSTGLENAYMVDGANTTGVEIGNQGKVMNFEFIQEVEIKAGGYEAEYTGAQGGILNVVTKSGGNEFHGDVFGYWDDDGLQAENKHLDEIAAEGVPFGFTRSDYGADVGGYILKDRLWFFGAYDHVKNTDQRQVTQGPATGTITDLDTSSNLYAGKLTWTITPFEYVDRHRLRRSHRRRRRGRTGHRPADDLQRDGDRRRHGLRRPLPGDSQLQLPPDGPVRVPQRKGRYVAGPRRRTRSCTWTTGAGTRSLREASSGRAARVSSR